MAIVADPPAVVIPDGKWAIDPVWSSLEFEVKKLGLMGIKGRVTGFSGKITGGERPSIEGTVDATSITTFDETRDGHLQSPDFFDTEKHRALRFESTEVRAQGTELVVDGILTIKGIAGRVELRGHYVGTAADLTGTERLGIELAGTIDRTEFGLGWNAPLPGGGLLLPNDVTLRASFAAVRTA
jgi:polyisoprenoid-binding protein YceI